MPIDGDITYALARVHARHAMRPTESEWKRLAASRDIQHYLGAVREGTLAGWVSPLGTSLDSHAIERVLRDEWRRYVALVAGWHPAPCRRWIGWLQWLPWLHLLAHDAHPGEPPAWILEDPVCVALARVTGDARAAAAERTPLAPIASAFNAKASIWKAWYEHWIRLVPAGDPQSIPFWPRTHQLLVGHGQSLLDNVGAAPPRSDLARRLSRLFRLGAGTPVATLCHVLLVALDLERLRGELVIRALFEDGAST